MSSSKGHRVESGRKSTRVLRAAIAATPALVALVGFNGNVAHAANQYWDSNGTTLGGGAVPTGTWGVDSFWNDQSDGGGAGVIGTWTPGNTAIFSAGNDGVGPYTVTVSGTQSPAGINLKEGSSTFTGGTIDLGATGITIDTAASVSSTIGSIVSGTGARLTKTGAGTLVLGTVLNQANAFDNGVTISGGVLEFPGENNAAAGANNPLGKAPAAVVANYMQLSNGATLRSTRISTGSSAFLLPNRGLALGAGGGKLEVTDPSTINSLLYSGVISGSGSLTKIGAGILQLGAVNTYSGDTFNSQGGILLNATSTFGDQTGTLHLDGGSLSTTASRSNTPILNPISITADTLITNQASAVNARNFVLGGTSFTTTGGKVTVRNLGSAAAAIVLRFNNDGFLFTNNVETDRGVNVGTARLEFLTDTGVSNGTAPSAAWFPGTAPSAEPQPAMAPAAIPNCSAPAPSPAGRKSTAVISGSAPIRSARSARSFRDRSALAR